MTAKETGIFGEKYAANRLQQAGYVIITTNYHTRYGEIDIIAEKNGVLAFIEVKTRAHTAISAPVFAVTATKRKKIVQTALLYLADHETDLQPRLDVIEVVVYKGTTKVIRYQHIENAYDIGE